MTAYGTGQKGEQLRPGVVGGAQPWSLAHNLSLSSDPQLCPVLRQASASSKIVILDTLDTGYSKEDLRKIHSPGRKLGDMGEENSGFPVPRDNLQRERLQTPHQQILHLKWKSKEEEGPEQGPLLSCTQDRLLLNTFKHNLASTHCIFQVPSLCNALTSPAPT